MTRYKSLAILLSVVGLVGLHGQIQAGTIKKCQDEDGKWHYGDNAAKECARSKVIEFSPGKAKKRVIDAPPTKKELARKEQEMLSEEVKKQRRDEQEKSDKLLLSTYAHEDDIIYERNRKIKDLDTAIDSGQATLDSLRALLVRVEKQAAEEETSKKGLSKQTQKNLERSREQVARLEASLVEKRQGRETVGPKYDKILKRYRQLRRKQAGKK